MISTQHPDYISSCVVSTNELWLTNTTLNPCSTTQARIIPVSFNDILWLFKISFRSWASTLTTSHYQMLTLSENTLMQQNLGGCCNLYWAVLLTVNRNKVHIPYSVCSCQCVYVCVRIWYWKTMFCDIALHKQLSQRPEFAPSLCLFLCVL